MVDLPGRSGESESDGGPAGEDPTVSCSFQDGTLSVYDEWLHVERPGRSKFSDKAIELADVRGVTDERRFVVSYLQIREAGFENDEGGRLSTPVGANTLHFGRGKRDCARRAADAIRDRAGLG